MKLILSKYIKLYDNCKKSKNNKQITHKIVNNQNNKNNYLIY